MQINFSISDLKSLTTRLHSDLQGLTPNNHHNQSHDHSLLADGSPIALTGVPALPASQITSGRFGVARMPDGAAGYALLGNGVGADPSYGYIPCRFAASDVLQWSNDTSGSCSNTTYTKVREIAIGGMGVLRIAFDLAAPYTDTGYGRIYRNGAAVGTERSTTSTDWTTYTEDISGWTYSDLLQLYVKSSYASAAAPFRNLRIYGTPTAYWVNNL